MTRGSDSTEVTDFSPGDQSRIHRAACALVEHAVTDAPCDADSLLAELADRPVAGLFVSLKRGNTLRGCCGLQGPAIPLARALAEAAFRTAKQDPRMAPVVPLELPYLELSISILGPPRAITEKGEARVNAIQVGRHGLRIHLAGKSGLLLPSVARERRWSSRQFLDAVCSKAGLPPGSWHRDQAQLEVFEGIDFAAPFCCSGTIDLSDSSALSAEELKRLEAWTSENLSALLQGATPNYYAAEIDDRTVAGIVLRVLEKQQETPASWLQLTIRDGLPLQSTLFQMTENAARAVASSVNPGHCDVELAVLSSIVQHGTGDDCELAGIQSDCRALIAMDGRRWSIAFDQDCELEQLLEATLAAESFHADSTLVFSAHCDATENRFALSAGPRPQSTIAPRAPAVAGMFYPADDKDRESLVSDLLARQTSVSQKPVNAAMVPHAGLHYSGRIAADVWRRISLPETVLIIGPKHTSDGVDWAVAPHDTWRLSATASLRGDVELSKLIAASVPGMELDAAAHAREHGIEVQLPILYRIAPQVRVAAIAMSGATFAELQPTAAALAEIFQSLANPPLLVISSDMNHFADEEENRRRDRIALEALQQNDPEELLRRCEEENISMCGRIPAALVLLTMQAMGRHARYQQIGYGTSAETSGDRSRVVGYAGVLF